MKRSTQIAVIGAGPGGYAAAFLAASAGMQTLLIDMESAPGGVCLYRGCIPSKALLHAVRVMRESEEAAKMGLFFAPPRIDLDQLRLWKDQIVTRLTSGLAKQCQLRGVAQLTGRAKFLNSNTLEVIDGESEPVQVTFQKAILATGSRPATLPGIDMNLPGVMDSTQALALQQIPASLLIAGGGNIGLELGTLYAALGTQVHIVEAASGLLPGADRDLVRPITTRINQIMAMVSLNTKITALKATASGLHVELENSTGQTTTHETEQLLVATGRVAVSDNLGLENTQVTCNPRGEVNVNAGMSTADPAILAIGDLTGGPMLAHKAAMQARMAINTLNGDPPPTQKSPIIPAVTYTDPELAWVGLTETQARTQGIAVRALRFPWAASGRAHTLERTEGLTKLILEPDSGKILGVGITGVGAGELIAEGVLAIEQGLTAEQLAHTIHPHPTLSETFMEAADIFSGHCVHYHAPVRKLRHE